jgi:hypothetical protein
MSTLKIATLVLSLSAAGAALLHLNLRDSQDDASPRQASASQPSSTPSRSTKSARPRATLADTVPSRVERESSRLTEELAEPTVASPEGVEPPSSPGDAEPAPTLEPVEIAGMLLDDLDSQTRDLQATAQAEAHVRTVLAAADGGGSVVEMDCRDRLCRAELAFDDAEGRDGLSQGIGALMPWDADGYVRSDPEDERRMTIYFTREGQTLPQLETGA